MKVKICGLTGKEDAIWAINYGADLLGVNFYKESPRHVSLASAEKWISALPSFANVIGVFVNADEKEIVKHATRLKLKGVQLHGDESPEMVTSLKAALQVAGLHTYIIKAIRVKDEESLANLESYLPAADYFLLDTHVEGEPGGTGTRFNWDLAVKAKDSGTPIFLAGGLTPDNVKEAIKKVNPFAVDVASGVEKSPRKKDQDKIKNFIEHAKK